MEIYRNAQWIVTDKTIEPDTDDWEYVIDIDRVFETTTREAYKFYDWPVHMAVKGWVDVGLFNDAFDKGIRYYARVSGTAIDEDMLAASYAEARRHR